MMLWWGIVPEMAWQAALVAGLVWIILRAGSRWPAPLRHGLLLVALVKFIVPPLVTSPFSLQAVAGLGPSAQTVAAPGAGETAIVPPWWVTTAPAVHAIGTALVIAAMTAGHARLVRLRRRSRLVCDGRLASRRDAVVDRLGMTRRPVLLLSDEVESPIACGLRRPAIVLPASLAASLSTEELDAVIAHEAGHHRRHDVQVAALRALVCALWWWHPLAWITARAIRHAQEDACDDLVVSTGIVSADRYC
ncbi:MAG: M56 family metallopeptidase, partial [Vicinamibacterales bacterium]